MKEKIYTMINDEIKEIELVAKEEYCEELYELSTGWGDENQIKNQYVKCLILKYY